MLQTNTPKLSAVGVQKAQAELAELIRRSMAGEEIIITQAGNPVAMLASPENIKIMSSVGAICYELPFGMGGFGWFGSPDNHEAKRRADEAYEAQFRL